MGRITQQHRHASYTHIQPTANRLHLITLHSLHTHRCVPHTMYLTGTHNTLELTSGSVIPTARYIHTFIHPSRSLTPSCISLVCELRQPPGASSGPPPAGAQVGSRGFCTGVTHSHDQMRSISAKHGCSLHVSPCDPALPPENSGGTRGASMTLGCAVVSSPLLPASGVQKTLGKERHGSY